jgi:hypothetical protein
MSLRVVIELDVQVGDSVIKTEQRQYETKRQVTGLIGVQLTLPSASKQKALAERERVFSRISRSFNGQLLALKGEENYYTSILELLGQAVRRVCLCI